MPSQTKQNLHLFRALPSFVSVLIHFKLKTPQPIESCNVFRAAQLQLLG